MRKGYTIPETENDWTTIAPVEEETTAAKATFTDINTTGDIYNSVYTVNQDLDVTLKNSKLVGVISSSNANHVKEDGTLISGGTFISASDPTTPIPFAGRVVNKASEAVNNDVNLTLKTGTEMGVQRHFLHQYFNDRLKPPVLLHQKDIRWL